MQLSYFLIPADLFDNLGIFWTSSITPKAQCYLDKKFILQIIGKTSSVSGRLFQYFSCFVSQSKGLIQRVSKEIGFIDLA